MLLILEILAKADFAGETDCMPSTLTIIGIGEALYDQFPDEARLGGAPLNVIVHAHALGNEARLISRIGQDRLGEKMIAELRERGIPTDLIQTDPDYPTGTVIIDLDEQGEPTFQIVPDVAYDWLQYDYDLEDVARDCDAICFGTVAQRNGQTRNTIYRFLETARSAIKLYDVNLRPEHTDRRIIERSLELANAVKVNASELEVIAGMFAPGEDHREKRLLERFQLKWLAVTRGRDGCVVHESGRSHEAPAAIAGPGGDRVGAGDATAAALLHGAIRRWPWTRTLTLANQLGAYVASQSGACPELNDELKSLAGMDLTKEETESDDAKQESK